MTDPDGQLAWFVPIIAAAVIGGTSQGIHSANNGGTFGRGFWQGALIGAAAAATGIGASALLSGSSFAAVASGTASVGFGGAVGGGAAGGAISGGLNAAAYGGNIGTGLWQGALGGAIGAGIGQGLGGTLGSGGGFLEGFGRGAIGGGLAGGVNSVITGRDLGRGMWQGAAIGGAISGTYAGIEARQAGANFFTGRVRADLSNGVGAHNLPKDINLNNVYGKYKGQWNGERIFESKQLGTFSQSKKLWSGGMTLPGQGIYVGQGVFSRNYDLPLMMHEFGHILQARLMGNSYFYSKIASSSMVSATKATYGSHSHRYHWTEVWANQLSYDYFIRGWSGYNPWNTSRFPVNAKN